MLTRILEPELMDTPEEARDYDEMDHREVNRRFVDDLLAVLGEAEFSGDVLDLGTGTALIPIELAKRAGHCRIMAADAAISMLELARYNVEIAGLGQRIQLTHVDAKRMPFADGMFDVVMSNSIIHHIPEPLAVLREAARVLKPGGLLFFRDLLRPATTDELDSLVATYAGNENAHSQQMFRDSLHAALTLDEVRALAEQIGVLGEKIEQTSDRHWTLTARKQ
jgi:ubiquinone/menaquinone biosynthesis C-methylase UbiE